MTKSTITREQAEEAIDGLEGLISRGVQSVYLDIAIAGLRQLLFAMDQKPALHRYRRKSVEPYGPYPWHYEEFVDLSRPIEGIEDEYYYAAPPAVSGFAVDSEPVAITDSMAYTFHHALTDGPLGDDEVEEIKSGLRAVFASVTATQPAPERTHKWSYGLVHPENCQCIECRSARINGVSHERP